MFNASLFLSFLFNKSIEMFIIKKKCTSLSNSSIIVLCFFRSTKNMMWPQIKNKIIEITSM